MNQDDEPRDRNQMPNRMATAMQNVVRAMVADPFSAPARSTAPFAAIRRNAAITLHDK
jgi:hypothetical protein